VILGIVLAFQYRVTSDVQINVPIQQTQELSAEVDQLKRDRDAFQAKATGLREQLDKATTGLGGEALKGELELARIVAGVTDVTGPGIEVTLNDSNLNLRPGDNPNLYVLHDEDVLRVLNELKAAGAEAIAFNGQRLLATTEVRCTGPTVVLNKSKRLAPPYIITAIGNPDTLEGALKMRGGVAETLQFWGIQITVKKLSQVTVPAYTGGIKFEYARPAG